MAGPTGRRLWLSQGALQLMPMRLKQYSTSSTATELWYALITLGPIGVTAKRTWCLL
eukprot:CAMPEP_0171093130 /NCGR_PEP_ID=MMETSP0766_2-20121228/38898_1 /TAXON_ID=439317 /ORGANISM="Gambierdiscus australes, Strain CAWD 149" /LENGTH=56 /DNA_ID=CAMNT_0011551523 /DNA_START=700 /DNA_END=866 /DNA_ORIENTATION=+